MILGLGRADNSEKFLGGWRSNIVLLKIYGSFVSANQFISNVSNVDFGSLIYVTSLSVRVVFSIGVLNVPNCIFFD